MKIEMILPRERERSRGGIWATIATITILTLTLGGCDFTVVNPGPVQDEFLDDPAAQESVVAGAEMALAMALNWISYTGGAVAREITAAGSVGEFGIGINVRRGILDPDESNSHWNLAQRARWVSEEAADRLERTGGAGEVTERWRAQALLWAGYSNRLLGESMCEAVIDGSAPLPRRTFLERAESAFSEARLIAESIDEVEIATAALAGRASVRVHLDDWEGAIQDASGVPVDFHYEMHYHLGDWDTYNRIHWAAADQPFRAHTVWNTFFEEYYTEANDPRVSWSEDPDVPYGDFGVSDYGGSVPFLLQGKYDHRQAPITLSSGREMRLIEAEHALGDGDIGTAMSIIDDLRASVGVEPWPTPNDETEAWTNLKRERFIEFWLEGRRLGDLHRWQAAGIPGAEDLEDPEMLAEITARDTCFPIPRSERQSNPNIP